jgi:hypothetical protein
MSIFDLFDAGDTPYTIDQLCAGTPAEVAQQMMRKLFRENQHAIVWTFYRRGLFRTAIRDGVGKDGFDTIHVSRTKRRFSFFESTESISDLPLCNYLNGVNEVYIQLCGSELRAFGLEGSPQGTAVGFYEF